MIDKTKFTCPYCKQVFGIDSKGNVGMYSYKGLLILSWPKVDFFKRFSKPWKKS